MDARHRQWMAAWLRTGVAIGVMAAVACGADAADEPSESTADPPAVSGTGSDDAEVRRARSTATVDGIVVDGPLAANAESYPFGAADHLMVPMDLAAMGYVEEEFIVRGAANVYDWPEGSREAKVRTSNAPYATRVLVRRPAAAQHFSGNAIVELLNPTNLIDLEIGWALSHEQFVRNGDAWVGVTSKPIAVRALQAFDPERYADLSWANPEPDVDEAACQLAADSDPATEDGLAWDIFSQVGAVLRDEVGATKLVGASTDHIYGFGYSQSGGMLHTYMTAVHPLAMAARGEPIYDGFLSATFGGVAPIRQCATALPTSDPRSNATDVGVPLIKINSQTDTRTLYWARKPDADTALERFRLYEVPGAGHATAAEVEYGPAPDDVTQADVTPPPTVCGMYPRSRFPLGVVFNAAFAHLDAWVRAGTAPPPGRVISVVESDEPGALGGVVVELDEFGNALGGVRLPQLVAPTSQWFASSPAGGSLICFLSGYEVPFEAERLAALYSDHDSYVAQVEAAATQLTSDGYLLAQDRDALVAQASAAMVP